MLDRNARRFSRARTKMHVFDVEVARTIFAKNDFYGCGGVGRRGIAELHVHFFLDFRLKELYI
jgi:hypothetical protein